MGIKMSTTANSLKRLALMLEQLMAMRLGDRKDLDRWYECARRVEDELTADGGLSALVPHFLWHYLADADIRMKDAVYASLQDAKMKVLVAHLMAGNMPDDGDLLISPSETTEDR